MKTPLPALAVIAFALTSCTKAPDPAPPTDEYAHEEIQQLRQDLKSLEAWVKAPNTAGLETADLGRRLMQYEQRIKSLEEQISASAKPGTSSTGDAAPSSTTSHSTSFPSVVPVEGSDYTPDQIAAFRKISDVVEKQRREEQAAERVKVQLTRIAPELTPDQEKAVTALTLGLQQKRGEVVRGGFGISDPERKATQEKLEALNAQFDTDVHAIPQLPTATADKLVEGLARGFGGGPRRIDGTSNRNGGMGN